MPQAIRVWNDLNPRTNNFGSLTCLARSADDPAQVFALGASHVLAPLASEASMLSPEIGVPVACRLPDGSSRRIGRLSNWSELQAMSSGWSNDMDAAIVALDPDAVDLLQRLLPQPHDVALAVPRTPYVFDGAATGAGAGEVEEGPVTVMTECVSAFGNQVVLHMTGMMRCLGPVQHGDSGALLQSEGRALGMLLIRGTEPGVGYFLPMRQVLDYFRLTLFGRAVETPSPARTRAKRNAKESDVGASRDILARTLWGEARGESPRGLRAVAAVVMNRASRGAGFWWGGTVREVCLKPFQFSCWNENDPNRQRLLEVDGADKAFRICIEIANEALSGALPDRISGATHYHTRDIVPSWARGRRACAEIGRHVFYNNIEP